MTNEKDRVAARRLIHTLGSITGFENRVDLVLAALATIRAEEREAAFNDFTAIVKQYIGACPGDAQLQLYAALKTATERD